MKLLAKALIIYVSTMFGSSALVMGVVLLAGPVALAQEFLRLVPQLMTDTVTSAAFSWDGQFALTGSWDGTVRLWDTATGRQIRSFQGHTDSVDSVVFSPDGRFVLTGSRDTTARLWDVATGHQIHCFEGHAHWVTSVAFSPDGRRVLIGSGDGKSRLWDAVTAAQLETLQGHTAAVESVAFSPDGRFFLTSSLDRTARLWDATSGRQIRSFVGHTDAVRYAVVSPNGRFVLTGGDDQGARLWDVESGRQIRSFPTHANGGTSVAFSPDGHSVLTGSSDGIARLLEMATGREIRSFQGPVFGTPSVAFSPDGRYVLIGGRDQVARLWDLSTGYLIRTFQGQANIISSVAFSPDGRLLLTGGFDRTARLWSSETGQQSRVIRGHATLVLSVAFSSDSRLVLTGSFDETARIWDAASGQELQSFAGSRAAFSRDGRFVLTEESGTVLLWDALTGKQIRSFGERQPLGVAAVAISTDSRFVLSGGYDNTVRLWDRASGQQLRTFYGNTAYGHTASVTAVAVSSDSRFVLTGSSDETAQLWEMNTGQRLRSFVGHTGAVNSVAFSPDNRFVLTGSRDRTARLWDAATGEQIHTFEGHSGVVDSVAFSPDGRFVLTGSQDTTSKLWDAAAGKEIATLISFENGGWAVTDPEGRFDTSDLDGGPPLAWVVSSDPMRVLPLEIFMRDYYTPRLLSRIMNGETLPPIRSIAEITNRVQPDVAVVSVTASKNHAVGADVVIHAASHTNEKGQASGMQDLRLFRNGKMVGYLEGALKDGDFTFNNIQLPTSARNTTFTAYAFNSMNIKSATAQKDYAYKPGAAVKPHAYLLQIGVNHYRANGCELHGSATDAEELSRVLTERLTKRGLEVKPARLISTLTENGATKQRIRNALAAIAAVATPDDVFFLSFSGHGFGDKDGQFYIFPADVEGSCSGVDDAMLKGAISAGELTEWLRPIDAGETTFVLDSCQSASSVEANDFKPGPMGSRGLGQLAYDKRMRILAASQSNQEAQERNLPVANGAGEGRTQGLVSYALTQEGLVDGKADWKPVDGKITVGEWLSYAADAVPKSLEAGAVKTKRGMMRIGAPTAQVKSAQIPAVFDFSKKDTFVLQ